MDALRKTGQDKNTIVVFTSDNGPWLIMEDEGGSAGLLRDGKGSTWEGGMREPCIFWSPGNIKPGIVTSLGTTMDLYTTFSKIAGVAIPEDRIVDGIDLSSVLFEGKESGRKDLFYYRDDILYAVRLGDYKAHFITQGGYKADKIFHDPPLLYNLSIDPSEQYNIANANPAVIAEIQNVIKHHSKKLIKGPDLLKDRESNR
jgi:arylsulfatase A